MRTIQFTSIDGTQEFINFDPVAPGWIAVNGSELNPANPAHAPVIDVIQNYFAIEAPTTQQIYDFAVKMDAIDWRWFGSYTDGNLALENTVHDFAVKYMSLLAPPPRHDPTPHAVTLTAYEYLNQDWLFNNGANLVGKTFITIEPGLGLAQVTYGANKFDQTWKSVHLEQGDEISLADAGAIWSRSFQSMANTNVVIDMPNGEKYDVKYGNTPNDQTWVLLESFIDDLLPNLGPITRTIQFTSIDGIQESINFVTITPGWIGVNGSDLNPANSAHVPVIAMIQNYFAIEAPTIQQTCDFAINMDAIDWRWFGSYTDGNLALENTVHDFAVKYMSLLAPPPAS